VKFLAEAGYNMHARKV